MTKLFERAVDSVRALPPEVQDELARLLLQVAGKEQPIIQLTPEERADIAEADAEITRGDADCKGPRLCRGRVPQGANRLRERIQTLFLLLTHHPYAGQLTDLPG